MEFIHFTVIMIDKLADLMMNVVWSSGTECGKLHLPTTSPPCKGTEDSSDKESAKGFRNLWNLAKKTAIIETGEFENE